MTFSTCITRFLDRLIKLPSVHSTEEMLPEKQEHGGPRVSAHSPATRQDTSHGSGSQHCHVHPSTLPSHQGDSRKEKSHSGSFALPPLHAVQHTPRQAPQSSSKWKKNHEAEQGRGEQSVHTHVKQNKKKKRARLLGRTEVCFSKKQGLGLFRLFWVIIFNWISKIIILILRIEQDIYF